MEDNSKKIESFKIFNEIKDEYIDDSYFKSTDFDYDLDFVLNNPDSIESSALMDYLALDIYFNNNLDVVKTCLKKNLNYFKENNLIKYNKNIDKYKSLENQINNLTKENIDNIVYYLIKEMDLYYS